MSSRDIERGHYLRRLFDKQLDKVDHKKDMKERLAEARRLMDEKLGPEWRHEAKRPGVEMIEVEVIGPPSRDPEEFFRRVADLGDKEGLGDKGSDAPEEHERAGEEGLKDRLKCMIGRLLDSVL